MMMIHSGGSARCDVQDSPARGSAFWLKAVESGRGDDPGSVALKLR